jgi:hypothetical protein
MDIFEKGENLMVALYTQKEGSTEKGVKVSGQEDGSNPMWLSRKFCRVLQKAKDGVRDVYLIPKHQAKYHKQLGGNDPVLYNLIKDLDYFCAEVPDGVLSAFRAKVGKSLEAARENLNVSK